MKKTIAIIMVLLLALISLTGCVSVNYEVKVNKNGSGDISYIYAFSKETLESLQISAEDMVASMKEQAEVNNYITEYYEDDEMAGFKATKHIDNLENDFSLQEAFKDDYVKDSKGNGIKIEKSLFGIKYSQNAEIDLTSMEDLETSVKISYTVKLPAKSKTNNATEVKGKTLTWNLTGGQINKIEFTATGLNMVTILILIIIVLVLVAAGVLLFIFFKKKNVTKKEK